MAELLTETQEVQTETVVIPDPFDEKNWKNSPTIPTTLTTDPVIKEKDEQIEKEKPESDKPNEPEKIPTATPEPIQERPENTDETAKEDKPLKFANEESEKVYNLILAGEADKALDIYSEQKRLKQADKLPPADAIKLHLQYQNKDFSTQEINDLFEDTYTMPEKPVQGNLEDDDEFKVREDKYKTQVEKLENRIKRDAKPATAELLKLSKEIVLPDIKTQEVQQPILSQEELAAQEAVFLKTVEDATNALNGYQVTFKDEEVSIPVTYKLTKEEKAAIQPLITLSNSNGAEFLTKIGWLDDKGNINAKKLAEDLPFILNKESVLQKMVTETGNKRHEASIKAIKNIDYSGKQTGGDLGKSPEQIRQGFENAFFI